MLRKNTISVIDPYQTTNFDFISLFDDNSKDKKSLNKILNKFDEDFKEGEKIFTDYIYVKNVLKNSTHKRILVVSH